MFEDRQVKEVVLAFDRRGLDIFLFVIDLTFQQMTGLLLTLFEDIWFYILRFLLAPLQLVEISLPALLFSCDIQISLDLHIRQYLIRYVVVAYRHLSEYHMSLPREQEIIGRKHLKFILNEFLHPLDFIQLSLQFYMITHKQTHLMLCYSL